MVPINPIIIKVGTLANERIVKFLATPKVSNIKQTSKGINLNQ